MRKAQSYFMILAGAAVVGATAGAALPASAWSVRQNAAFCMGDGGADIFHAGAGVQNNSTVGTFSLACPVIDTSATPKTGVTALSVSVHDNSTTASVFAGACVQLAAAPGGQCGALVSTSVAGTGMSSLSPPRTRWTGANDWPYLVVALPPRTPNASLVYGYTYSG